MINSQCICYVLQWYYFSHHTNTTFLTTNVALIALTIQTYRSLCVLITAEYRAKNSPVTFYPPPPPPPTVSATAIRSKKVVLFLSIYCCVSLCFFFALLLFNVVWLLVFCVSSSRCHVLVCNCGNILVIHTYVLEHPRFGADKRWSRVCQ